MSEVPENYATVPLGEIASASKERGDPTEAPDSPYVGLEHIEKDTAKLVGKGTAAEVKSTKSVFREGDLLYGKLRPYLNKVWLAEFEGLCSTDILVFSKSEALDNKFLKYRFLARDFVNYASANSSGVNLPRVNLKALGKFEIDLPPLPEQRRIVARIEELFSRLDAGVAALHHAKAQLQRYRQSVLAAAVTGQLTQALPSRQAGWRSKSFRNISDKRVPEKSDAYFVYVLECDDGSLYKGFSKDLFRRINQHLDGQGAKWTREHPPVALIHFEEFPSEKEAVEREKYFKSGSGREWLNEVKSRQTTKHEPAEELLQRILRQRREQWNGRGKYTEPVDHDSSDLKALPESWTWSSFESVLTELRNGISKKPDATDGLRILRISAVRPLAVDLDDSRFLSDSLSKFATYELEPNDLLFTRYNGTRAFVGVCGLVPKLPEPFVYPDKLIRARLVDQKALLPSFVEIAMNAGESRRFLEKRIRTTAGQSGISGGDIKITPLPIPPLAEQHQIVAEVEARTTTIDHLETELDRQITRSNRLRQSTLSAAFSGSL